MKALIVSTGLANTASVVAGLRRAGVSAHPSADAQAIAAAPLVVMPGVGTFGAGMASLDSTGLRQTLIQRIDAGRPTLAVCLGFQLLCEGSDESPQVEGLGLIPGRVTRFAAGLIVPQMGWNDVVPDDGCSLMTAGSAYFANSYKLSGAPAGWRAAWAHHGGPFISALERGAVLACQFHPELSGRWGQALIRRWIAAAREASPC